MEGRVAALLGGVVKTVVEEVLDKFDKPRGGYAAAHTPRAAQRKAQAQPHVDEKKSGYL